MVSVLPRILIADDHKLFVEGLRKILDPDFEVLEPVADGRALLQAVPRLNPNVVLMDISMPLLNGLDATAALSKSHPHVKTVIITMHQDVAFAARAFDSGASGYLLKYAASTELHTAISEVLKGNTYVPPQLAQELLRTYRGKATPTTAKQVELTPRQREVLQLLAEGKTAREAAEVLNLSVRTVEFHKYRIMDLLGIKTSAELMSHAARLGLV